MDNHEGPDAYSQTGTSYPLPDLWRGSGTRDVRTQYGSLGKSRIVIDA
jgi:hypothetical protein